MKKDEILKLIHSTPGVVFDSMDQRWFVTKSHEPEFLKEGCKIQRKDVDIHGTNFSVMLLQQQRDPQSGAYSCQILYGTRFVEERTTDQPILFSYHDVGLNINTPSLSGLQLKIAETIDCYTEPLIRYMTELIDRAQATISKELNTAPVISLFTSSEKKENTSAVVA